MTRRLQPGWSEGCLSDVVTKVTAGTSANCEDRDFREGDRRVLKLSAVSGGRFIPAESKVVARSEHSRLRTPVRSGTVLFTRKNTPELVGDSAYISEEVRDLYLPDLIWELNTAHGIEPRWLNHWLQAHSFRRQIPSLSAGSSQSMVGISQGNLLSSPVLIPPQREQKRIVAVLDAWDQGIGQIEQLISMKWRRYRGLLARYSAEFHRDRTEFGEIVHLVNDRVQPGAGNVPGTSIELENIESETGRILGRQNVTGDSSLRSRFESGDTLFGKLRPYLRKFAKPEFDGICSTEIWVLRAKELKLAPSLLFYLVQTSEFSAAATKQSGSRMPRADWDLVSAAPVPCPRSRTRQLEASAILSAAMNEIHPATFKLDALRTQKRGLMQKLLTGEWRLDERFDAELLSPRALTVGGRS